MPVSTMDQDTSDLVCWIWMFWRYGFSMKSGDPGVQMFVSGSKMKMFQVWFHQMTRLTAVSKQTSDEMWHVSIAVWGSFEQRQSKIQYTFWLRRLFHAWSGHWETWMTIRCPEPVGFCFLVAFRQNYSNLTEQGWVEDRDNCNLDFLYPSLRPLRHT